MNKRLLSWLLAVCMLLSMLPLNAFAAEVVPSDEEDVAVDAVDAVEEWDEVEPEDSDEEPAPPEDLVGPEDTEEVAVPEVVEETLTEPAAADGIENISIQVLGGVSRFDTDRNPTADCWTPIDVTPDYVQVDFTVDGRPVSYSGECWKDVEKPLQELYGWGFSTESTEEEEDPWTSGSHSANYILQDSDWNELARCEFSVTVLPSPILDIQTYSGITVNVNEQNRETRGEVDGWSLGDYPTDCVLTYIPREKYNGGDFDWRTDSATFTGTGSELVEMLEADYGGTAKINHFACYAWQDTQWEDGDEGTCEFYICGVGTKYPVTGVSGPAITGIEADSVTMFLGDNQTIWDDETQTEWSRLDCCTESASVSLSDGKTISFSSRDDESPDDLVRKLRNAGVRVDGWGWTSEETSDNHWNVGKHPDGAWFWLEYQGVRLAQTYYDVEVLANPIASIQVDDITRIYESREKIRDDWSDEEWYEIDCNPDHMVVTLTNGTVLDSNEGWPGDQIRNRYAQYDNLRVLWHWESDQGPGNEWNVGTHTARQVMLGKVGEYKVNVINAPFDEGKMELSNPIVRAEGDRNWHAVWLEDEGRLNYDAQQRLIDCWPGSDENQVVLRKNGEEVFRGPIDAPNDEDENEENCLRGWLKAQGLRDDVDWASYETDDNSWEAGEHEAWLMVCGVRLSSYSVKVISNPIDSIEVESFSLFFEDCDLIDDWPTDDQNPNVNRRYDVYPGNITVHMKDGETKSGDLWEVRDWVVDKYDYDTDWGWYHDPLWGDSKTLHAYVTLGSGEYPFIVPLVDSPVKTVRVDNINRFLTDTYTERYWDEEQQKDVEWQRVDCWPDQVTLTLKDGTVLSGNPDDVREKLRELYPNVRIEFYWESDERSDAHWTTAGTHTVNFCPTGWQGATATYQVTVIEDQIKSVHADNVTRYESERQWLDHIGKNGYAPIDCWPDRVTVTLKDGSSFTGSPDEVREALERKLEARIQMDWWSIEGWEDENDYVPRFEEGKTYKGAAWFVVSGVKSNLYDVTVTSSPIASIEDFEIWRFPSQTHEDSWWGEDGPVEYNGIDLYPGAITVKLIDQAPYNGKVYENVNFWDLEDQLREDFPDMRIVDSFDSDQRPDNVWGVGDHTATLRFCGFTKDYDVHVVENPVTKAEVEPITVDMNDTFPWTVWYPDENGVWKEKKNYPLIDLTPKKVTVHFKNSADKIFTSDPNSEENFMDQISADLSKEAGFPMEVYWDSDQMPGNPWYPGAHKGVLVIGDVETEYDVQVNADLTNATVTAPNVTYTGKALTPAVTVKVGDTVLRQNEHYKAVYSNNTNAGTGKITVTGIGACSGTWEGTFTIQKANQSMTVTAPSYIGKNDTATLTVKNSFGALTYTPSDKTIATVSGKGVVKGLKGGTVTIKVKAAGDNNHNAASKQVKITIYPCTTPAAPTLQNVGNNGLKISWAKVSGAAKYRIFYKYGTKNWTKLADTTATSYTWTKGVSGTKYTFTIRCLNSSGGYASDYNSTGKSIVYYPCVTPAVPTLQNAPTGLKISWAKVSGAAKYRIFYKYGTKNWTKLADTTATSYTWTKAASGTKYAFTIRCISKDGKTYTSNYNNTGKSIHYVAAPTLANSASKTMKVSWKKITGVTGYQVSYATASNFKGAKTVNVKGVNSLNTTIKKLKKGTTYYVRIRTYTTKSGKTTYSAWSAAKSLKLTK